MTYTSTDFSDDIFNELCREGAIKPEEASDEALADNASLQGDYALRGIARLARVRDAAAKYLQAVQLFAASKTTQLSSEVLAADLALSAALASLTAPATEELMTAPTVRSKLEVPEAEEARRGQLIADTFLLRKDLPVYPDRYKSATGNKTALGVFRTMKRLIEDGE